eukprot:10993892-Prorocentrum_lima.AAC.1
MTSSLVGSEMCIRDRSWRWWWCCVGGDDGGDNRGGGDGAKGGGGVRWSCLLYTSDAADDM